MAILNYDTNANNIITVFHKFWYPVMAGMVTYNIPQYNTLMAYIRTIGYLPPPPIKLLIRFVKSIYCLPEKLFLKW